VKARVTPAAAPPPRPAPAKAETKSTSKGWQAQAKAPRSGAQAASAARKDNFVDRAALKDLAKELRDDLKSFAKDKGASVSTNADGSQTRTRESTKSGTTRTKELTSREGPFGASDLSYESSKKTARSTETHSAELHADAFGRRESTVTDTTANTKGNVEKSVAKTTAKGALGLTTESKTTQKTTSNAQGERVVADTASRDNRGNRSVAHEESHTVTTGGKNPGDRETSTTSSTKTTSGRTLETANQSEAKDGTFSVGTSDDWKSGTGKEASWNRETGRSGQPQDQSVERSAPKVGDVLREAGVGVSWNKTIGKDPAVDPPKSFVGSRAGVTGEQSLSVDPTGVSASFNREASAGLYAESRGSTKGQYGEASYEAIAKLEAKASVDAQGKLNSNGLDASVGVKAGVSAEASISGSAKTASVKVGGVDVSAGVEGSAKVSASASAEATGKVQVTRKPPTAIIEGEAGASAVLKAEADVKVSAGPFAVTASGYASAGAEAKASGIIGYQDGKLKLGGSLGAAVGVGLGGGAAVEINVKQIGEMTHIPQAAGAVKKAVTDAADVNHDGKVDGNDAKRAATAAVDGAKNVVTGAAKTVADGAKDVAKGAANTVKGWFGW
jgi:hypothetical protein